jgi:hypothetical protein
MSRADNTLLAVVALAALATLSCTPPSGGANAPEGSGPRIAETHRAKCGNCHVRVEPGTRSREVLEAALSRHRKRVHLTEAEWAELLEYLASTPTQG